MAKRAKCQICGEKTAPEGSNVCTPCYDREFGPDWCELPPLSPHPSNITRRAIRVQSPSVEANEAARACLQRHPRRASGPERRGTGPT